MKIVVDTNIVFSAILNTDSRIARILLYASNQFDFYAPSFLKSEISQHKSKILQLTKYSEAEFWDIQYLVIKNILFIDDALIKDKYLSQANAIISKIDASDTPFFALALQLKSPLWTGDKKIAKAIKESHRNFIMTTNELIDKL